MDCPLGFFPYNMASGKECNHKKSLKDISAAKIRRTKKKKMLGRMQVYFPGAGG